MSEVSGANRLILLRHGRTEWNASGVFQGQTDVPLDELGVRQAEQAAEALAGESIDQIWSSDLARAHATALAVAKRVGLPVTTSPELREINVGTWAGLTVQQAIERDPELGEQYLAGDEARRSPSGETETEVGTRVGAELARIAAQAPDGSTVLVGIHGLAAREGTVVMLGLPPQSGPALGSLLNCHWADLRMLPPRRAQPPRWRLHTWNLGAPDFIDGETPVGPAGRELRDARR